MNFLRLKSLPWIMALLLLSGPTFAATYVETFPAFQRHIQLHRTRVVVLGLALAHEHFPQLSQQDLKEFLSLHDTSKTDPHNSARLFRFFGKPPATDADKALLHQTVDRINDIDARFAENYFKRHPELTPEQLSQFQAIEKVADFVDRAMDPVAAEEFGRSMTRASQFLRERDLAEWALWLEERYGKIVPSLAMPPINSCQRALSL